MTLQLKYTFLHYENYLIQYAVNKSIGGVCSNTFRIKRISQKIVGLQLMFLLIIHHIIKGLIRINPNGLEGHISLEDHVINLRSQHT